MSRGVSIVMALSLAVVACGGGGGGGGGSGIGLEDLDGDGQVIIIAFGDSITRGTGDGEEASRTPPAPAGYPSRLEASLGVPVYNAGRPGEETPGGRSRLPGLLAQSSSDYVILLEGVNDLQNHRSPTDIVANLQSMIDAVIADGGIPVLGTLTPTCCNHRNAASLSRIQNLNGAIGMLAADNSIPLIDFYSAFTGAPDGPFDVETGQGLIHDPEGLHPTPAGYDVMAEAARDAFR